MNKICSYIIDIIVLYMLSLFLNIFINKSTLNINLYSDILKLVGEIGNNYQVIDKLNYKYNLVNFIILVIYTLIPLYTKSTFGQKIFNLKLQGNVNLKNILIRNILIYGYIPALFSLIFVYIIPSPYYFLLISTISIIQIIFIFVLLKNILKGNNILYKICNIYV